MIQPAHPFVEFTMADTEQSISARFEQQVARYPAHLAVQTRHRRLTYDGLNRLANRVARAILARRGHTEEAVALLLDLDDLVPAALLGALKPGNSGWLWIAPTLRPASATSWTIRKRHCC